MLRRWSALAVALPLCAGLIFTAWHLDAAPAPRNPSESKQTTVDIELVLAVDISYSMDPDELALQREGYSRALTSAEFLNALRQGIHGKIAITYFEWAGAQDQKVVVPWRVIDGPESAGSIASEISQAPLRRAARTSISGALLFGMKLFESSGQRGIRRVIDISAWCGWPRRIYRDPSLAPQKRRDAGCESDEGLSGQSACALHDRRAHLAGALGELS